jgi:hypothetical protein
MFCDQKCLDEGMKRLPDLISGTGIDSRLCDESKADMLLILRTVYECLTTAGSVDNLRALMEPKPELSIQDLDLSDNETIGVKHLKIISMMKEKSDEMLKRFIKIVTLGSVCLHPLIANFIKSNEDKNFIAEFAARFFLITQVNAFGLGDRKDNHADGILPFECCKVHRVIFVVRRFFWAINFSAIVWHAKSISTKNILMANL